ncbi:MAG: outer membrane beta-barrel protein [Flavobacteriales bacterium]|nr:outer membrane beta-barrel protein [Flavobacteriales bacterium]
MKAILMSLMLVAGTTLSAQLETGNILINVDYEMGFGYSQSGSIDGEDIPDEVFDMSDVSSGLVRVDAQYQVADAISAGLVGRFGSFTTSYDDADLDDDKTNVTEVGVEARYSLVNTESINVFVGPSFGISNTKADEIPSGEDEDDYKTSGTFYQIAAGGQFFLNELFGLNLRVGYGGHSGKQDLDSFDDQGNETTVEAKSSLSGIEVGFGVSVKL